MKILIINQPLDNRGDESAHRGLMRALVEALPKAHFEVLFVGKSEDSIAQFNICHPAVKYSNISRIPGYRAVGRWGLISGIRAIWYIHPTIVRVMRLFKGADMVICAPGGVCMGGFKDWAHLLLLHLAKYYHKPLIYYGRSFGPFYGDNFERLSREIISYFSFFSIRDHISRDRADKMGIEYSITVDSAFLDSPKSDIPSEIIAQIGSSKYIIFVPNLLNWHYTYSGVSKQTILSFYRSIVAMLVAKYPDYKILMLPQTYNNRDYQSDVHFFEELKIYTGESRLEIVDDKWGSDIQQAIISGAEYLVGARYHSIVFAINNATPFLALGYEEKILGLLKSLSEPTQFVDITGAFKDSRSFGSTLSSIERAINAPITASIVNRDTAKKIARSSFSEFLKKIEL